MRGIQFMDEHERALADTLRRVRAEFIEMPGMQLTRAQAARLWHLDQHFCDAVLSALVDARFLVRTRKETFVRAPGSL
jgi:hypothetical protein